GRPAIPAPPGRGPTCRHSEPSRRFLHTEKWPRAGAPPVVATSDEYDRTSKTTKPGLKTMPEVSGAPAGLTILHCRSRGFVWRYAARPSCFIFAKPPGPQRQIAAAPAPWLDMACRRQTWT